MMADPNGIRGLGTWINPSSKTKMMNVKYVARLKEKEVMDHANHDAYPGQLHRG